MSEQAYLTLLSKVLEEGEVKADRTGTGTRSLFGEQLEFDLSQGFPLLTTKKVGMKIIAHELVWFLRGETNISYLAHNNVHIWDEWADSTGDLGPIYGSQWRSWGEFPESVDQIGNAVNLLLTNPHSRRIVVSAWNPSVLPDEGTAPCQNPPLGLQALAPCHCLFQFYVREGSYLDCKLYQRSGDIFLGVPFNIASYSLLTALMAHVTGLKPGRFIHTFGDVHLYLNHISQAEEQLSREPREFPTLTINQAVESVDDFMADDYIILNYNPHPAIKGKVAI